MPSFLMTVLTNSIYEIGKERINRAFVLNFGDEETANQNGYGSAGMQNASGLVPSIASRPNVGTIIGPVLVIENAASPSFSAISE